MRLANMSRWPYGLLIAVLVAFPIALYVRIPKADPVRMDNVPIDRLTRSVWMPPGAKNPLPLPDGSELEVLGITKGVSGPEWGLDGKLLDDAAERRFRMALSDMGAKPTASNITLAFRLKASPDSMIDTSPMDGLETAGYSCNFSGQGLVVQVQSPSTTKPGRLRLAFEPELARPEHIATLSAGQGRQNGIEWVVETPSAIAAFLSKKKSDPTVECRLTLPGLMAGCAVKVRTDASVKGEWHRYG